MTTGMRRAQAPSWFNAAVPVLAAAGLFVGGGCVRMPLTGTKASGEPLLVDVHTEQRSYVAQEKTGEVVHRDAAGNVIGTSEAYQDKLVNYNVTQWQVFQGNDRIDDQDFFRIAGDDQAADQIASMRNSALTTNRVGIVLLGVGLAALGAGLVTSATLKETDPTGFETAPAWPRYLAGGGVITALVGGGLMWYGAAAVARPHPIDDPRRAKRVGDKYNATLGKK